MANLELAASVRMFSTEQSKSKAICCNYEFSISGLKTFMSMSVWEDCISVHAIRQNGQTLLAPNHIKNKNAIILSNRLLMFKIDKFDRFHKKKNTVFYLFI